MLVVPLFQDNSREYVPIGCELLARDPGWRCWTRVSVWCILNQSETEFKSQSDSEQLHPVTLAKDNISKYTDIYSNDCVYRYKHFKKYTMCTTVFKAKTTRENKL